MRLGAVPIPATGGVLEVFIPGPWAASGPSKRSILRGISIRLLLWEVWCELAGLHGEGTTSFARGSKYQDHRVSPR